MPSLRWPSPPERMSRPHGGICCTVAELRLPARASELKRARSYVSATAIEFGLGRRESYELVSAVNEAVTNAIRHGRPGEDGTIGLTIESDGASLICSVRDRGPFMAHGARSAGPGDESGRGFALMSALTDELELLTDEEGTVVRLRKLITDEAVHFDA